MAYLRLSDNLDDHPKFAGLSDGAFRYWVHANLWVSRHLTDGSIPIRIASSISKHSPERVRELLAAGLWHDEGDRYRVHDYLDHNASRDEVIKLRKIKAERMVKWRASRQRPLKPAPADAPRGEFVDIPRGVSRDIPQAQPLDAPVVVRRTTIPSPLLSKYSGGSNDPPPSTRAGEEQPSDGLADTFWQSWRDLFRHTQAGAVLPLVPRKLDELHLVDLVAQYPDPAYLLKMAELFLRLDLPDLRGKPRSLGMFKHWAPWCDTELRRAGIVPEGVGLLL